MTSSGAKVRGPHDAQGCCWRSCAPESERPIGIATATERELFDFVTDPAIGPHNIEACINHLISLANERAVSGEGCGTQSCLLPVLWEVRRRARTD